MALVRKASAMGCLSQLRAFTQHLLGKIDPSVLQVAIRAGAKQCPKVTLKLPKVIASHLLKLIETRTENNGGLEKFARPHHGCLVGDPHSCRPASRIVNGMGEILKRVFIRTGILDARAVDNGCNYCLAAHSYLGQNLAKLGATEIAANRHGTSNHANANVAVRFAVKIANSRGAVDLADVSAVKAAGYSDAEIIEIIAYVALNTLTNSDNEVLGTEIDFPQVETLAA